MSNFLSHLLQVEKVKKLNQKAKRFYRQYDPAFGKVAREAFQLASTSLRKDSIEYWDAFNIYSAHLINEEQGQRALIMIQEAVDKTDIDLLQKPVQEFFASTVNNLGAVYFREKEYSSAVKYMIKSVRLKVKLGMDKRHILEPLQEIIECYEILGDYEKEQQFIEELNEAIKSVAGENSPTYKQAVINYERFLKSVGKTSSKSNKNKGSNVANKESISDLIGKCREEYMAHNFTEARKLHLTILQDTPQLPFGDAFSMLGESLDPVLAFTTELDRKAVDLKRQRLYTDASKIYDIIVAITGTSLGEDNIRLAFVLNNYAGVTREMKDYERTGELFDKMFKIIRQPVNAKNSSIPQMLENVASFYHNKSLEYAPPVDEAEAVTRAMENRHGPESFAKSMRIQFLTPQEEEPRFTVIRDMGTRIVFYESVGDLAIATQLMEDRLKLSKIVHYDDPRKVLDFSVEMAEMYAGTGKFNAAQKVFDEIIEFVIDKFGKESLDYIELLHRAGAFYGQIDDLEMAEEYMSKSIELANDIFPDAPDLLRYLKRNLIMVYRKQHKNNLAEPLIREVVADLKLDDLEDPASIEDYGNYLEFLGDRKSAESAYSKAMSILLERKGQWDLGYALVSSNLASLYRAEGRFAEAIPLYEQALAARKLELGPIHPKLNQTYIRLALAYAGVGLASKAISIMNEVEKIDDILLDQRFSMSSERQKLAVTSSVSANADVYFSLFINFFFGDKAIQEQAFNLLQKRKTNVNKSASQLRKLSKALNDNEVAKTLADLEAISASISTLAFSPPKVDSDEELSALIHETMSRKEELERDLTERLKDQGLTDKILFEDLSSVIDNETSIVEFLRYENFQFAAKTANGEREHIAMYLAFIITNRSRTLLKVANIPDADKIDELIERFHKSVRESSDEANLIMDEVTKLICPHLNEYLNGNKRVVICPDGQLAFLPFDLLRKDDGREWIDHFAIRFEQSLSDIMPSTFDNQVNKKEPAIIAYPDYYFNPVSVSPLLTQDAEHIFHSLNGSLEEGKLITSLLGGKLIKGRDATKQNVLKLISPSVLHIATHGFYRNDTDSEGDARSISGLALAGANLQIPEYSGILTAEEISFMKLDNTELVVLSACESGIGKIVTREGVWGLPRSFQLAGAKRIVFSLWQIPDNSILPFINQFYSQIIAGNRIDEALREAKLAIRDKDNASLLWSAFNLQGDGSNI